jgi:hypothetical protein
VSLSAITRLGGPNLARAWSVARDWRLRRTPPATQPALAVDSDCRRPPAGARGFSSCYGCGQAAFANFQCRGGHCAAGVAAARVRFRLPYSHVSFHGPGLEVPGPAGLPPSPRMPVPVAAGASSLAASRRWPVLASLEARGAARGATVQARCKVVRMRTFT